MSDGKRILIVGLNYAPEHTGIAPYTTGVARGLADAGHRVTVIAGYPYYPQWRVAEGYRRLVRHETDGNVAITRLRHHVPSSSTGPGRIVHEASFALHALLRTIGREWHTFDVVIGVSPSLLSTAAARWIARRAGAPFGVVVQDIYANSIAEIGALGGRAGSAVLRAEGALLRGADGIVAVHDHFERTLRDVHDVASDHITVIRNWTHIRPPTADRALVRREFGWPDDRLVVLHAGNMGAKQDLTSVVRAARLADERSVPIHFVLVGDGAQRHDVVQAAVGVPTVSVSPPVAEDRFPDLLAAADVLLVNERPGLRTMSVPSKLTSYFAAGRPVVAVTDPDSPANAELTSSGAGVRVPPGEPSALLDAVLELGDDRVRARWLGENGRRYADAVLCERDAVAAYGRWVEDLVKREAK
ncbi:glycosyltransferase involved in cell wall biosynthesis [Lentzea atacamensis]|uniref:Glycosyltransferase involved in cell wall biosynthesis n=1 Tax=Lentzea atacamensis TaxID=531938 RepID=A0A316I8N9_9PSEU|nr:glycosyltransferase family 4 protein [Lentzea atacamensis]PWK89581.1 glycosyltransferase involved in cell wall biosynthesis [Lentzea atacamensis]RAS60639.1 glycosyltransferase involved in cell wall biosynthesis [Lentzea atacamensis]